ncbi:MAG TPA: hypothetical protein VG944_20155 [Fimbriimonas sp.]|nr:hypothetical protein [Fimbriimonas sp.]
MPNLIPCLLLATAAFMNSHVERRALWVWHGQPLIQDNKERAKFYDFLAAPKGNSSARISVIFLSRVGIESPKEFKKIGNFIAQSHERGIRVDYLCGEAYYAAPERHKDGFWQLEYMLRYNRQVPAKSRFDGIQFDVEPYMLPKWPAPRLVHGYLSFLSGCKRRIEESRQPVQLGAAIPRWFDAKELNGLYRSVLDRVDYAAVMDYVDRAEAFVHDAKNTVAYASLKGKDAWLGAEATELPDEPMATFYKLGNARMEEAFRAASTAFFKQRGFAGVAIEYYETYRALKP